MSGSAPDCTAFAAGVAFTGALLALFKALGL